MEIVPDDEGFKVITTLKKGVSGANILIANKTKTVIQKTRGHTSPPIKRNRFKFLYGVVCPFFSSQMYA